MNSKNYADFLKEKTRQHEPAAITDKPYLPRFLFRFQKHLVKQSVKAGRFALFADTGLGKTAMQLAWAENVIRNHGDVLILTPLAVKEQTIREAKKFKVGKKAEVVNYDQLHKVDASKYAGVVLDESSILKNFTGKMRTQIIEAFSNTPFRLACTATPAPNDHTELGNHSEFLGALPRHEMLSEFFVHDAAKTQDWRLKGTLLMSFGGGFRRGRRWLDTRAILVSMKMDTICPT